MFESLTSLLNDNPLVGGGVTLAIVGWVVMQARTLPLKLLSFVKSQFTTTLTVYSEDSVFRFVDLWLSKHPDAKRSRRFGVASWYDRANDKEDYNLSPGAGFHLLRNGLRLWFVSRVIEDKGDEADAFSSSKRRKQTLTITTPGRNHDVLRLLLESIKTVEEDRDTIPVYLWTGHDYSLIERRPKRSMDTVYLDPSVKDALVADIARFLTRRAWYALRGIPYRRGFSLEGPPGCVAEGTMISYRRGKRNSSRTMPIEQFYARFNGKSGQGRNPWRQKLPTYVQSWDAETGKVFYNEVKGVFDKGVKTCITLVTARSGEITLTHDHPVLAADGTFKRADSFLIGDRILAQGDMKPKASIKGRVSRPRVVVEGLKYYASGWGKSVTEPSSGKVYHYQRTHRARLVIEAHMNNLPYEDFLAILRSDETRAKTLKLLPRSVDVHHINEDPTDDRLTNLMVLDRNEHWAHHAESAEDQFNVEYTVEDVIVGVKSAGDQVTYDLSMAIPCANFVTNDGIIVHNTGKTTAIFALASHFEKPVFIINPNTLENDNQLQRAINQAGSNFVVVEDFDAVKAAGERSASQTVDEDAPITLYGGGEAAKSGITLSGILNAIDGIGARDGRVLFITSNHADTLDAALMRPGRIDKRFVLNHIGVQEVTTMFQTFFPQACPHTFVKSIESELPLSPAEVQNRLLGLSEEQVAA